MRPLKTKKLSLSIQAQRYLLNLAENGTYQPGEQLPSEADLAAQLGISRPTLREALLNLEQKGVVVRRHGVGTFIAPGYRRRLESGLERLQSILELAVCQRVHVGFDALQVDTEPAGAELAGKLRVKPGTLLTSVRRVIVVEQTPIAYMFDVAPAAILSPEDVDERFNGSVLDLLREKEDLQLAQASTDIIALNADDDLAAKLSIEPGQAVLLLQETLFDERDVTVEFSRNYFVPDFFNFRVVRR